MKYSTHNPLVSNCSFNRSQVFIYTALDCEAKPLVSFFNLKKESGNHPFSIYKNDQIILTVSGIGKTSMAGAVTYSMALYLDTTLPIILNVGISGHKVETIGTLYLAIKIIDADTDRRFYPQLIGRAWPETCEIITASMPVAKYKPGCLYDMEASAFYEMALKFSSRELIHCIKVVSDNESSSIEDIRPGFVIEWITNHVKQIENITKRLIVLRESISSIGLEEYEDIIQKWHFTVSGKVKLKGLLMRWKIITKQNWQFSDEASFSNSKTVLQKLEADIDRLDFYL